jgi:probable phosphoglycerate mutase
MIAELVLVRHAESENAARGMTGGWTDLPLTPRGIIQAERAGAAVAAGVRSRDVRLVSSDLARARQTAEIISRHLGVPATFVAALRELNNGLAKDKTLAEAESLAVPPAEPLLDWFPYPGAESWRAMATRVIGFLESAAAAQNGSLVIVSHGNAMISIVHWWLRLDEPHWSRVSFEFGFASITRLKENEWGERVIVCLNDTSHLEAL